MRYPKKFANFTDRQGRAAFIAQTFEVELNSSERVLDVGCDYNSLKKIVGKKVLGIDLYGAPDIKVDFEKDLLKQFNSNTFDFVVCTEVLEHLEHFHAMVDELFRVSRKYVLISLPNSLSIFAKFNILFHDNAGKYYGLPQQPPEDRHRWFFGYKDIDRFFRAYTAAHGYQLNRRFLVMNFSTGWKGKVVRLLVSTLGLNSASGSYWLLIEKPHD